MDGGFVFKPSFVTKVGGFLSSVDKSVLAKGAVASKSRTKKASTGRSKLMLDQRDPVVAGLSMEGRCDTKAAAGVERQAAMDMASPACLRILL